MLTEEEKELIINSGRYSKLDNKIDLGDALSLIMDEPEKGKLKRTSSLSKLDIKNVGKRFKEFVEESQLKVKEVFEYWAKQGGGEIDKAGFYQMWKDLRIKRPQEQANEFFEKFDEDKNGKISLPEFKKMLESAEKKIKELDELAGPIINYMRVNNKTASAIFAEMVSEKESKIGQKEFADRLLQVGIKITSQDAQDLFELLD